MKQLDAHEVQQVSGGKIDFRAGGPTTGFKEWSMLNTLHAAIGSTRISFAFHRAMKMF